MTCLLRMLVFQAIILSALSLFAPFGTEPLFAQETAKPQAPPQSGV
jgi:hypothetical protein